MNRSPHRPKYYEYLHKADFTLLVRLTAGIPIFFRCKLNLITMMTVFLPKLLLVQHYYLFCSRLPVSSGACGQTVLPTGTGTSLNALPWYNRQHCHTVVDSTENK